MNLLRDLLEILEDLLEDLPEDLPEASWARFMKAVKARAKMVADVLAVSPHTPMAPDGPGSPGSLCLCHDSLCPCVPEFLGSRVPGVPVSLQTMPNNNVL